MVHQYEDAWKVVVIESERGWGQSVVDVQYFDTEQEANEFVSSINSRNTSPTAPDWYMQAQTPIKTVVKVINKS